VIPTITLPSSYEFGDKLQLAGRPGHEDLHAQQRQALGVVEVFNVFNVANWVGYSSI